MLEVKKEVYAAEHQLATVNSRAAQGISNTQASPSSSAQAPPGLSIQSGTPVALQPQHGVFNAILPEKMLAPINIHCEQTGTSPMSGSSATPPVVAMPKQMGAMEQVPGGTLQFQSEITEQQTEKQRLEEVIQRLMQGTRHEETTDAMQTPQQEEHEEEDNEQGTSGAPDPKRPRNS